MTFTPAELMETKQLVHGVVQSIVLHALDTDGEISLHQTPVITHVVPVLLSQPGQKTIPGGRKRSKRAGFLFTDDAVKLVIPLAEITQCGRIFRKLLQIKKVP